MNFASRLCVAVLLALFFAPLTIAQVNHFRVSAIDTDKTIHANRVYQKIHRQALSGAADRIEKMGAGKYAADFLSDLGYTDTTINDLRKNGVDLLRLPTRNLWGVEIQAALSDCIVIGTVSRITHPEDESWFQTVAYVKVERFLKNNYSLVDKEIPIMIVSGPTRTLIGEDTLGQWEHVLLFLSASSLIRSASYNMPDLYNRLVRDSTVRFEIKGKYVVGSGKITTVGGKMSIPEVEEAVAKIDKIARHYPSTER
jgi:hypothetical protein